VAYSGILFGGGVQQIQLRTEDRENGDLGAVRTEDRDNGDLGAVRTEDRDNGDLGAVAPQSGVLEAAVIWYTKFHFI